MGQRKIFTKKSLFILRKTNLLLTLMLIYFYFFNKHVLGL
jgi:hypothetical protein